LLIPDRERPHDEVEITPVEPDRLADAQPGNGE